MKFTPRLLTPEELEEHGFTKPTVGLADETNRLAAGEFITSYTSDLIMEPELLFDCSEIAISDVKIVIELMEKAYADVKDA